MKRTLGFILAVAAVTPCAHAIIGGVNVSDQLNAPRNSVVALQLNFKDQQGKLAFKKASGVIIGKRAILTAGHNLFYMEKASDVEVIFSPRPCWGLNVCKEKRLLGQLKIIHPEFRNDYPLPPVNDIAILTLEKDIPESYSIASLPSSKKIDLRMESPGFRVFGY
jgi:hypothetical protein